MEKHSFLSNLLGNDIYEKYRPHSVLISIIVTIVITILLLLSKLVYWKFVSFFVDLFFGYSLIFILYVASIIRILDIRIPVYSSKVVYSLTTIWGCILIFLGICALHYTDNYRYDYEIKCSTCLLEKQQKKYHLFKNCDNIKSKNNLIEIKCYEADELGYKMCDECDYWLEELKYELDDTYLKPDF